MSEQSCEQCANFRIFEDGDTDCDAQRPEYGNCPLLRPCPDFHVKEKEDGA